MCPADEIELRESFNDIDLAERIDPENRGKCVQAASATSSYPSGCDCEPNNFHL